MWFINNNVYSVFVKMGIVVDRKFVYLFVCFVK